MTAERARLANPAVTIARSLSNSFAGIAPGSVPSFILAQLAAVVAAVGKFGWLFHDGLREEHRPVERDLSQPKPG